MQICSIVQVCARRENVIRLTLQFVFPTLYIQATLLALGNNLSKVQYVGEGQRPTLRGKHRIGTRKVLHSKRLWPY
jgi:hypothetical protein